MQRILRKKSNDILRETMQKITRTYDSFGNPYSEAVTANNVTKTVSRRMTDAKTYQFTYPDGKTLRKTATGNDLDSIEYGTTGNLSGLASYSRANGVLTAITKGQNLIETFSYNNWNMLDNHTVSNANADVYDMSYNYSRGWHLVEKADGIKHTSDKYSYDSYYRLKEVKYDFVNNAATRTDNFYQDGVHNIEQSTENGVTFAWGVDKLNRLREKEIGGNTAVTYKYDERNNMIGEDFDGSEPADISYIYDDLNRLIEVKDGNQNTIATYTYDAFNRRITKTVGNTTERYSYDDWNIVEISTNSNDYTNIIDSAMDRHIAIEVTANNTSTIYYFLTDERGNVTALTDANGNVLERYRYRVYGDFEILDAQFAPKDCSNQTCYATSLHNFLWGGSLYEPETGLYWMRNRYYHIDMHRFINQDPIGIWGDANNLGNGFAYVAGMVIEASDPTGLEISYLNENDVADNQNPDYPLKECSEKQKDLIQATVDNNSVVAEQWDQAESSGNIVFIGCNCDDSSYTKSYGKDYRINIGNEDMTSEEKLAHELYHFNNHGDLLKRYDELKKKYENGTATGEEMNEFIYLDKKLKGEAEEEAVKKQQEAKDEEDRKKNNEDGKQYPSDPDNSNDSFQQKLMESMLTKILRNSDFSIYDQGPVVKIQVETVSGHPKWVFVFNPFYRGKDPMKEIFWETRNADGTKGWVRNPFAPGAEYGYDSTTYEKFQQSGFPQTNVDPYWY